MSIGCGVYGHDIITDGCLTMEGDASKSGPRVNGVNLCTEYCWRVGGRYFETGTHEWKVRLHVPVGLFGGAEVGIIDYNEINAPKNVGASQKLWVLRHNLRGGSNDDIFFFSGHGKKGH